MQLQGYVTYGMCKIPAHYYAKCLTVTCDQLDVEELARVKLNAWEQDESGGGGVLRYYGKNLFVGEVRGGRGRGFDSD
jgi:hypothetical protein